MSTQIWWDDTYEYEVELIERKPITENEKVIEWILKYKVLSQEKIKK